MASYEIEEFLVATFDKGVTGKVKSTVHPRQLAKLNYLLQKLKSPDFFDKKNTRGYLYDLQNSLDECLRLSGKWFPCLIHNIRYRSVGYSLRELKKKLLDEYKDLLDSSQAAADKPAATADTAAADPAAADAKQEGTADTAAAAAVEGKEVHGFMEELVAVERLVVVPGQQDGFKAVGIAGNAGVGKTTLCKELLKRQEVRDLYVPRIYVHLPDKEQVVDNEKEQEKSKDEKDNDKLLRDANENKAVLVEILKKLGVEQKMIDEIRKEHNVDGQPGVKEETVDEVQKEKNDKLFATQREKIKKIQKELARLSCAVYAQLIGKKNLNVLDNVDGKLGMQGKMTDKIQKEKNDKLLATQKEEIQKELDRLSCAVYAQLIGKKYLIVLDNVTSDAKWYNDLAAKKLPQECNWRDLLAYALPKGYGGTVVVTSRRLRLVNNMVKVDANVHRLVPRADKDFVLKMFKDSVHKHGLQLEKPVEKEIIKKCAGFPLAAKMMGDIMQEISELKKLIEESTENTTAKPPPPVETTENKTAEESSKASTSEIKEEKQPKESQETEDEEEEKKEEEEENVDGVPPSDED